MASSSGGFFKKHRRALIVGIMAAWVVGISLSQYLASRRRGAASTAQGAGELLQIGALPVT